MADISIETGPGIGNPAEYEGIDFRELRCQILGRLGLECAEVYIYEEETGYEQTLDQDNVHIELNQITPGLDRIAIQDERDNTWWAYFRDEVGSDDFDEQKTLLQWIGKTILTLYPQPDVVEMYNKKRKLELAHLIQEIES